MKAIINQRIEKLSAQLDSLESMPIPVKPNADASQEECKEYLGGMMLFQAAQGRILDLQDSIDRSHQMLARLSQRNA